MKMRPYFYRGRWSVHGYWQGQRIQVYQYIDGGPLTEDLAHRLAARMNSEIDSRTFDPARYSPKRPFGFDKAWALWYGALTCSEDTKRHYKWDSQRWILPFWGTRDIRDLRGIHIQEFLAYLKGAGGDIEGICHTGTLTRDRKEMDEQPGLPPALSSKTIRNIMGILHACLHFHSDSLFKMPHFPAVTVQTPKIHPLTAEEQDRIFKHLLPVDLPIFTFMRWTGVRPSEACGLQWDCVDRVKGEITIKRAMGEYSGQVKACTKTHRERTVYIIPEIEGSLKRDHMLPFVFVRRYRSKLIPYNTNIL